jgi:hypothetical protein
MESVSSQVIRLENELDHWRRSYREKLIDALLGSNDQISVWDFIPGPHKTSSFEYEYFFPLCSRQGLIGIAIPSKIILDEDHFQDLRDILIKKGYRVSFNGAYLEGCRKILQEQYPEKYGWL